MNSMSKYGRTPRSCLYLETIEFSISKVGQLKSIDNIYPSHGKDLFRGKKKYRWYKIYFSK